MLIDVRWAHFYSPARRKVFVELPEEAGTDKCKVGRLLRSTHGCRDAGVNREFAICQVMIAFGFVQGRASPCIYRHLEKQLRVWVHGDDFVSRLHRQCQMVLCETARVLDCHESRNPWTPPGCHDCVQSIRVLGRIVEWTADGITWEADLRHAHQEECYETWSQ